MGQAGRGVTANAFACAPACVCETNVAESWQEEQPGSMTTVAAKITANTTTRPATAHTPIRIAFQTRLLCKWPSPWTRKWLVTGRKAGTDRTMKLSEPNSGAGLRGVRKRTPGPVLATSGPVSYALGPPVKA